MSNDVTVLENLVERLDNVSKSVTPDNLWQDMSAATDAVVHTASALYGSGVKSFMYTLETERGASVSEDEYQTLFPLIDKWNGFPGDQYDEEVHHEFCRDLQLMWEKNPELVGAGKTLVDVYNSTIWNPYFSGMETKFKEAEARLRDLIDKSGDRIAALIESNYSVMDPYEFERFVSAVFDAAGYETEITAKGGDFGVDVLAFNDADRIAIQVKRYNAGANIGARDIQAILGAMQYKEYRANKAIVVTTSDFTVQAKEQADGAPVELWTSADFNALVRKYMVA
ncbi:restriction endonuclease [Thioalkalivibrio sp. ALMg11]|uniref:restriction endonuclease n=1 Tax=Thioalkalivibrio sp. ALMg11 TaxID=1158165 RepID=UPI00036F8A0A|nr:restriction endonuclease [Thioalkalivibrio sp. ALMg11]